MRLLAEQLTPALMVRNEEFWIYYVLRDLLQIFPNVVMLDTGSTDRTVGIARGIARISPGKLTLVEKNFGDNANLIGNTRNDLRAGIQTKWMFLVDGDEIWTRPQLDKLLEAEIPDDKQVVMAGSHNLEDVGGTLQLRADDIAHKDILFVRDIEWTRTDYPFEGYGLSNTLSPDRVHYLPAGEVFCWHMRHTRRSSKDSETYFRAEKLSFYPYSGAFTNPPAGWLGSKAPYYNPYRLEAHEIHERGITA